MSAADKIHAQEDLAGIIASHKRAGRRVVFTNGAFDLIHVGHVRALEEAALHGGVLVVAVNDDASVRAGKGPGRPVVPAAERAEVVASLQCVDYVTLFSDETVDRLLEMLEPDVHAKGRDYTPDTIPERRTAQRLGIEIEIVGDEKMHSSTQLLARAAGTRHMIDHVVQVHLPDARGVALRQARRLLDRHGWLDAERLATTEEGALVHQRRHRTVRRLEIDGRAVYVKVTRPLESKRSPLMEHRNVLIMRAAGFRAPEPWLALEGEVQGERTGILVTREAPGLPLDEYLALALKEGSDHQLLAIARGLGSTLRALHTARLFPPDLQAWHLYVEGSASGGRHTVTFIDLMRLDRGGARIRRAKAARGLAALALSVRGTVPDRFQLAMLKAYLGDTLQNARPWLRAIQRHMARLETRGTFRYGKP